MNKEENSQTLSLDSGRFKMSIRLAVSSIVFLVVTVAAGAFWAQSVRDRMDNIEGSLKDIQLSIIKLNTFPILEDHMSSLEKRVDNVERELESLREEKK
jgi:predicted transcriptional regulator